MLRGRHVFSDVGTCNLGKRRRRDSRSFVLMPIVRSKKTNRTIGKLFLIPGAPLCHIDDAPRNDLAHSTGIGRPGALVSRPEEPVPGLIEGRTKHSDGFGIEGRPGPDQINNADHPRTLRQSGRPAPPDRGGGGFHLLCDDLIHWQRCGSSVCLLRCNTNDARRKARKLMRVERSAGENRGRKSRRAAAIKPFKQSDRVCLRPALPAPIARRENPARPAKSAAASRAHGRPGSRRSAFSDRSAPLSLESAQPSPR